MMRRTGIESRFSSRRGITIIEVLVVITGVAMMWLRVARPSMEYLAVLGLQSNFHSTRECPWPSPAGSKL